MSRLMFDNREGSCDVCGDHMFFGSFEDNDTRDVCYDCQREEEEDEQPSGYSLFFHTHTSHSHTEREQREESTVYPTSMVWYLTTIGYTFYR